MKRVPRGLRSFMRSFSRAITFACLILALAIAALFVRSYFRHDSFYRQGPDQHGVASVRGHFGVFWTNGHVVSAGLFPGAPIPSQPAWVLESIPADPAFL